MSPLRVGLIGYGLSGAVFHAPLLSRLAEFELCAIASSRRQQIRQQLPDITIYDQPYDLLQQAATDLDLVVITTPNDTHFELAHAALELGLHVVLEKPMVLSSVEGESLRMLARQKQRVLSVFHNRRFDSDFLTIARLLKSQQLGPVHTFIAHFDRYRPQVRQRWKEQASAGGGVLYDLGSHLIDQALCLFGKPATVLADLRTQRSGSDATDYFWLRLDYPGLQVILHSGCLVAEPGPRYQIHGLHGSFIKHGFDVQESQLKQGIDITAASFGVEPAEQHGRLTTVSAEDPEQREQQIIPSQPGDYSHYYRQLAAAIGKRDTNPICATEAINVIRVIEAAIESSQQERKVELL